VVLAKKEEGTGSQHERGVYEKSTAEVKKGRLTSKTRWGSPKPETVQKNGGKKLKTSPLTKASRRRNTRLQKINEKKKSARVRENKRRVKT